MNRTFWVISLFFLLLAISAPREADAYFRDVSLRDPRVFTSTTNVNIVTVNLAASGVFVGSSASNTSAYQQIIQAQAQLQALRERLRTLP